MFDSIFASSSGSVTMTVRNILIILGISVLCGAAICVSYMFAERKNTRQKSFAISLIMLPSIIGAIIYVVGTNIASAFSLGGAFSLIRFRSNPGSPKDIVYVFLAMASGFAAGMGYIGFAVLFTAILCVIMIVISTFILGTKGEGNYKLKIYVPEDLNYKGVFDDTLAKFTRRYTLGKVSTSDLGSVFVLSYDVTMSDTVSEKQMIDELRTKNGNLNIIFSVASDEAGGFSAAQ